MDGSCAFSGVLFFQMPGPRSVEKTFQGKPTGRAKIAGIWLGDAVEEWNLGDVRGGAWPHTIPSSMMHPTVRNGQRLRFIPIQTGGCVPPPGTGRPWVAPCGSAGWNAPPTKALRRSRPFIGMDKRRLLRSARTIDQILPEAYAIGLPRVGPFRAKQRQMYDASTFSSSPKSPFPPHQHSRWQNLFLNAPDVRSLMIFKCLRDMLRSSPLRPRRCFAPWGLRSA